MSGDEAIRHLARRIASGPTIEDARALVAALEADGEEARPAFGRALAHADKFFGYEDFVDWVVEETARVYEEDGGTVGLMARDRGLGPRVQSVMESSFAMFALEISSALAAVVGVPGDTRSAEHVGRPPVGDVFKSELYAGVARALETLWPDVARDAVDRIRRNGVSRRRNSPPEDERVRGLERRLRASGEVDHEALSELVSCAQGMADAPACLWVRFSGRREYVQPAKWALGPFESVWTTWDGGAHVLWGRRAGSFSSDSEIVAHFHAPRRGDEGGWVICGSENLGRFDTFSIRAAPPARGELEPPRSGGPDRCHPLDLDLGGGL